HQLARAWLRAYALTVQRGTEELLLALAEGRNVRRVGIESKMMHQDVVVAQPKGRAELFVRQVAPVLAQQRTPGRVMVRRRVDERAVEVPDCSKHCASCTVPPVRMYVWPTHLMIPG